VNTNLVQKNLAVSLDQYRLQTAENSLGRGSVNGKGKEKGNESGNESGSGSGKEREKAKGKGNESGRGKERGKGIWPLPNMRTTVAGLGVDKAAEHQV
jgi:hypothetical protein